ncbi:MAG TPA: hypothetical protein PKW25_03440 [Syntrophomonadaceae bacterium]|nr:hypothetical protein [Syntrophomonadaceae bacterium]
MHRLTRLYENYYVVDHSRVNSLDEGYAGEAVEQLAKFENFYEHLLELQQTIPAELDKLRCQNKTKTYRFRELMAQKHMNENTLKLLSLYGLD